MPNHIVSTGGAQKCWEKHLDTLHTFSSVFATTRVLFHTDLCQQRLESVHRNFYEEMLLVLLVQDSVLL
jgi:hypothetical protein